MIWLGSSLSVWNDIPITIQNCTTLASYKKALFTRVTKKTNIDRLYCFKSVFKSVCIYMPACCVNVKIIYILRMLPNAHTIINQLISQVLEGRGQINLSLSTLKYQCHSYYISHISYIGLTCSYVRYCPCK